MKLKSYFSGSVESAMALARKELGDEALLVHARPATPETRYLGAYEVVFGVVPTSPPSTQAPTLPPEPPPLRGEIDELRRQIERLTQSFEAPLPAAPLFQSDGLLEEELNSDVAGRIRAGARLEDLLIIDPSLGAVVALVGPPGVGKTTTLMKLAVRHGLAQRRSVHVITTDVHRIAAADQIRALSAILGIGCDVAETPGALTRCLEDQKGRDLVLIDTPGYSSSDFHRDAHEAAELAEGLMDYSGIDTHLVLSAASKPKDMARITGSFEVFEPSKLLFTRVDETTRYGAVVNEAVRSGLPISFLSNGQQIPQDLEAATIERLSALVLGDPPVLASRGAAA